MHCPRCGQQQVSDEMRFCSRCGLSMSGLAEWLYGGGVPAVPADERPTGLPSPRRKGIRRAAKLMFVSGVLFPVFLAISAAADEPGPLIVPFGLFFISLVMMLYARLFSDNTPSIKGQTAQASALGPMPAAHALPPPSNIPMPNVGQQVRTNELAYPPSVTEHTTKLLDQD